MVSGVSDLVICFTFEISKTEKSRINHKGKKKAEQIHMICIAEKTCKA